MIIKQPKNHISSLFQDFDLSIDMSLVLRDQYQFFVWIKLIYIYIYIFLHKYLLFLRK